MAARGPLRILTLWQDSSVWQQVDPKMDLHNMTVICTMHIVFIDTGNSIVLGHRDDEYHGQTLSLALLELDGYSAVELSGGIAKGDI